jgi:[acyl-carrier-protein] S-malonyltransferase
MSKYKKIAFLFPGQGAQYPGMAKDFAEQFPAAKALFEQADDILKRKLSTLVLHGPAEVLTETRHSQAGIFVASLAMLAIVRQSFPSLQPYVCAGLSLGEYTALCAGGWLSFEQGLPLVDRRGAFMNDACIQAPGTMAVVMGLPADTVAEVVREVNMPNDLWAANYNCPGQVVISGTLKGIEAGGAAAKAKGAKRVLPLQVHGAFHSGLMQSARARLTPHLKDAALQKSSTRLVMNVPGNFVDSADEAREYLIQQVTQPVRWEQGIRAMMADGVDLFIEIGCGKTLSGMNKRIDVPAPTLSVEKIEDLDQLAKELG